MTTSIYSPETERLRGHLVSHSEKLAGLGLEPGILAPESILCGLHITAWHLQHYYQKETMAR